MVEVHLHGILKKQMDILFIALNPPDASNSKGHYFSRVSTFWDILYESGLIVSRINNLMEADEKVFKDNAINYKNLNYGVYDLVHIVESDSKKVKLATEDMIKTLSVIESYKPSVVCLMHNKVRKAFIKEKIIPKGLKYGRLGNYVSSIIFLFPFRLEAICLKKK